MARVRRGSKGSKKSARRPGLIFLAYGPLAATFLLGAWGVYLSRRGDDARVNRLVGPLCLISFGWTFIGFMVAAALYGSIPVLATSGTGARRWARVALAYLPVMLGLGIMGLGVYLLVRNR